MAPDPHDGDLFGCLDDLTDDEQMVVGRVREIPRTDVAPITGDFWLRGEFPHSASVQRRTMAFVRLRPAGRRGGVSISMSAASPLGWMPGRTR